MRIFNQFEHSEQIEEAPRRIWSALRLMGESTELIDKVHGGQKPVGTVDNIAKKIAEEYR